MIAGYGRFGQMVGRILRANRITVTILDLDPEMVDVARPPRHQGLLRRRVAHRAAPRRRLGHARLFVLAVDDKEQATAIAENVRHHFPNVPIIARARDRQSLLGAAPLGVKKVFRETFASAYEIGIEALSQLGYRAHTAHRLARKWRDHEEKVLEELGELWGEGSRGLLQPGQGRASTRPSA